jgi:hypothetical protein
MFWTKSPSLLAEEGLDRCGIDAITAVFADRGAFADVFAAEWARIHGVIEISPERLRVQEFSGFVVEAAIGHRDFFALLDLLGAGRVDHLHHRAELFMRGLEFFLERLRFAVFVEVLRDKHTKPLAVRRVQIEAC